MRSGLVTEGLGSRPADAILPTDGFGSRLVGEVAASLCHFIRFTDTVISSLSIPLRMVGGATFAAASSTTRYGGGGIATVAAVAPNAVVMFRGAGFAVVNIVVAAIARVNIRLQLLIGVSHRAFYSLPMSLLKRLSGGVAMIPDTTGSQFNGEGCDD